MEHRITEQASVYDDLQQMSVHDILTGINREDARVHEAVRQTIPVMEQLVERIVERMQRGGRIFYIGAGTSGRLGVTDASELPPTYGVPFDLVIGLIAGGDGALRRAVEHAEDDTEGAWRDMAPYRPTADDTLIGIAASGTTPYVIGGLREARRHGLLTGSVTCNPASPVADILHRRWDERPAGRHRRFGTASDLRRAVRFGDRADRRRRRSPAAGRGTCRGRH